MDFLLYYYLLRIFRKIKIRSIEKCIKRKKNKKLYIFMGKG